MSSSIEDMKNPVNNLQCEHCNKILSTASALELHKRTAKYCLLIQNKLNEVTSKYKCDKCDYSTTKKDNLNKHLKTCKQKTITDKKAQDDMSIKYLLLEKENEMLKKQIEEYKNQADKRVRMDALIIKAMSNNKRDNIGKRESIPKAIKAQLWERDFGEAYSGSCQLCSEQFKVTSSLWHASHIISHAQGGSDNIENLTILCASCNLSMGAMSFTEYKSKYQSQINLTSDVTN